MKTLLIVPAMTDQAGQCRIVAREGKGTLADYRAEPRNWTEVGIMNSRGDLVCIEPEFNDLYNDVPLAAGTLWYF